MGLTTRGRAILAAATLPVLCAVAQPASATTYFWDGDGVGPQDGGAGLWNTTNLRWEATDEGSTFIAWPNLAGAAADSAVFDDVASAAVTIGGALNVNTITTTVGGYTIGNGNGVGGAANTI